MKYIIQKLYTQFCILKTYEKKKPFAIIFFCIFFVNIDRIPDKTLSLTTITVTIAKYVSMRFRMPEILVVHAVMGGYSCRELGLARNSLNPYKTTFGYHQLLIEVRICRTV